MTRNGKIALGALLFLVLFLTYLEASEPEPVNWNPSYQETDKIALGSFVLYESWQNSNSPEITNINIPPFEFLDQDPSGTYFFLNDHIVFDDHELDKLLQWVEKGNSAFISAGYIGKNLLDTLNMKATTYSGVDNFISRPTLNLTNPKFKDTNTYKFSFDIEALYFNKIDRLQHIVLGTSGFGEESKNKKVNFVKAEFGQGEFLLHTNPEALGNYFLLSDQNYEYAEGVLSYINSDKELFWDKYYKTGKTYYSSPLYILLNNRALKWAYYLCIFGIVLFIIFEGKRKQRAVPVIVPLKNRTFEYSKTISELYVEQKKYKDLALKKIEHFNDYIRNRYRIDTSKIDRKFYRELAAKSNNTEEETRKLFDRFNIIISKNEFSKDELMVLNNAIQSFKQQKNE